MISSQHHLSKETTGKPTEAAPISPPRQDRVIHVISDGSEISGISHAAAKKSTWNAKHGESLTLRECKVSKACEVKGELGASFKLSQWETSHVCDEWIRLLSLSSCIQPVETAALSFLQRSDQALVTLHSYHYPYHK
ncbi:hypothetical protein F2Q69_00006640 [Brassica cretica]|uniref:Uncharacterized protein n=1 Tax=Brassica cretica TaxID=69181 RepID=A0A8S9PFI8_BRACR|nr:hypothetical protein F2Q69_00006640 [Brassica cretica]